MGRKRREIGKQFTGGKFYANFWHPISRRTVRVNLGNDAAVADGKLRWLNSVHLDPTKWRDLPVDMPVDLRAAWLDGMDGVRVSLKSGVKVDGKPTRATADREKASLLATIAGLQANLKTLTEDRDTIHRKYLELKRRYERERGGKLREGPSPTLADAAKVWKKGYTGRDAEWTKVVCYDVDRFVREFGGDKPVDGLEGCEHDIDSWLRGLTVGADKPRPIGAGRRAQIRRNVIRFLDEAGVLLNRKKIKSVKKNEVRRDRGSIRWLESKQAENVAAALPAPWADVFRIQTAIGLRPSEVATLKRADFNDDMTTLTLSPIAEAGLTLKTGPRTIGIHRFPAALQVLKPMLADDKPDILFSVDGKPWKLVDFMRFYNKALKAAAKSAGVKMRMDARVGRRTCASNLLRNGKNVEQVAALLGDNAQTIREHYAAILPQEV